MYTNVIDNSGRTVKPDTVVGYVQIMANRDEKNRKRIEELELKINEQDEQIEELKNDLDNANDENLRLENQLSEVRCELSALRREC